MKKEDISPRQGIDLIILYTIGSAVILPIAPAAGRDAWISIIAAFIFAIPFILMYSRLLSIYRGKDFYEIIQDTLGSTLGRIFAILYLWYFLHLSALIVENFVQYVQVVALGATPAEVIVYSVVLNAFAVKLGIEVLGRFADFYTPIIILTVGALVILLLPQVYIKNLLPIMYNGIKPVAEGAFSVFTFPILETVAFLVVLSNLNKKVSVYNVFLKGAGIGSLALLLSCLMAVTLLTGNLYTKFTFPADIAVSRINVGDFLERLEITVSAIFLVVGFVKATVCCLAAAKAVKYIFNLESEKPMAMPISIGAGVLSLILFENTNEMVEWSAQVYPYYALPFQLLMPIIVYVLAELKHKKLQRLKDIPKN